MDRSVLDGDRSRRAATPPLRRVRRLGLVSPVRRAPCLRRPLSWTAVPPTGTVYATTTVRRPFLPGATRDDVPVTTILVELDHAPGVRLVARVEHGAEAPVGTHVAGRFVSVGERMDLRFEPR